MIKNSTIVWGCLILMSIAWLEWIVFPKYGSAVLLLTLPVYAAFTGVSWRLGYRLAEKRSREQVDHAIDRARFAEKCMSEVMQTADEMKNCYTRMYEDAIRVSHRNTKQLEEIEAQRKAMAEEAEILETLILRHRPYEEIESRLQTCEKERLSLKDKLKRIKKVMQLDNIAGDVTD